MATVKILIVDRNEEDQQKLLNMIHENITCDVSHAFNVDEARSECDKQTFDLIIIDPLLPAKVDGDAFIEKQRQFYSINVNTPIIVFSEDLDFVSDISSKYKLHPEAKFGDYIKILNPIKMHLEEKPSSN